MIRRWPTVEQALLDEEFLQFLRRVRTEYPIERAELLLDSLGIEIANEREAYYSTNEWAAAILNVPAEDLKDDDGLRDLDRPQDPDDPQDDETSQPNDGND